MRISGIAVGLAAGWLIAGASAATQPLAPMQQGLIITSALRAESGDRENVVKIVQADAAGVSYSWQLRERDEKGVATLVNFYRFVLLADRNHPLVLKVVTGPEVLQVIRIDLPVRENSPQVAGSNEAEGGGERMLAGVEGQLQSDCRAELPGIYFDFAAATLTEDSRGTIASLAQIVGRHPEWQLSIEGHTDDIGTDADNLKLSQARAQAVITSLTRQHGVNTSRLAAKGFGESQPREPNTTLEGRARNRRVEVVRPCK